MELDNLFSKNLQTFAVRTRMELHFTTLSHDLLNFSELFVIRLFAVIATHVAPSLS